MYDILLFKSCYLKIDYIVSAKNVQVDKNLHLCTFSYLYNKI
ncbi:hypothetical protein HMPREF0083_02304 [Aneurinibacillus aneurinilyticus ATCC 12856]|uniref:Uncharacterized protein n=1 Tax=Aneurinibacillus aneurinilyticus ATCC 12856 TaxID=649747 RepID=U1YFL6_ANEAE|nr:hypothetical protein HMPREF0083_02304 [Aneurinibacillus aneurinilyticus ATCC 12856]